MKRKFRTAIAILALIIFAGNKSSNAQDLHFSQFYSTLININPGATGTFAGDLRFLSNYRSQFSSIQQPYTTMYASVDIGLLKYRKENGQGSFPAIGLSFLSDKAGAGDLSLTEITLSASYNLRLAKDNMLTAGFRVGNAQRKVNFKDLIWDSQYNNGTGILNTNLDSGEPLTNDAFSYVTVSSGLLWNFSIPDRLRSNIGFALNRLNRPDVSFYKKDGEDKLNSQMVIHSSNEILFNKTDLSLLPHFLFIKQGESKEFTAGLMLRYAVSFDSKYTGYKQSSGIYAGAFFRTNDAIVLATRVDFRNNFSIGFSYDMDTTPLKDATGGSSAFEVMLTYTGFFKRETHLPRNASPQFL